MAIDPSLFAELIRQVGEDPSREGLHETPARAAKAWADWTCGYDQDPATILKTFEDGAQGYDQVVFQGGITLHSHCEHHLAPIFGLAHVGYLPGKRVVGLSKLARLVDVFAHRLQVQERMTSQIAAALQEHLQPRAVGVVLQCRHFCIESRGIRRVGSVTQTVALHGDFRDEPAARAEFMALVHNAQQAPIL